MRESTYLDVIRNEVSSVRNEVSSVRNEVSSVRNEVSSVRNEVSSASVGELNFPRELKYFCVRLN